MWRNFKYLIMAFEQKEGQGSLFKNEKGNDRQPDYRGRIMIGGTVYEIAAWERTSRNGASYLSLQAQLPREQAAAPQGGAPAYQAPSYQAPAYQAPVYQAPQSSAPAPQAPFPTDEFPGGGEPVEDLPF